MITNKNETNTETTNQNHQKNHTQAFIFNITHQIEELTSMEKEIENEINMNSITDILMKIFGCKKNKRGFRKLSYNLIEEIVSFLHISDVSNVKYISKQLLRAFKKYDYKLFRLVGDYSYGLFKALDFENHPTDHFHIKQLKSNKQPVFFFEYAKEIDMLIISPGPYLPELTYWSYSNKIYKGEIKLNNILNIEDLIQYSNDTSCYISSIKWMSKSNILVIGIDKGYIIGYEYKPDKNSFDLIWKRKFNNEDSLSFIDYVESKDHLITLEKDQVKVNYIKTWSNKGKLMKKSIHTEEELTCLSVFDIIKNNSLITYSAFGSCNGKIYFINYENIEDNFNHISYSDYIKGPITEVDCLVYVSNLKLLIVAYRLVGIYIWIIDDISLSFGSYPLLKRYVDLCHFDIITSIVYITDSIFCTSSLDRDIIIWDINKDIPLKKFTHPSSIYNMKYSEVSKQILTSCYDKNLRIISLSDNGQSIKQVEVMNGHVSMIKCFQIDLVNSRLITASTDNIIKVWNYKDMSLLKTIDLGKKEFCDGMILIFDSLNTIIKVDLKKQIKVIRENPEEMSIDVILTIPEDDIARVILNLMDGMSFAVGLDNGSISIYYYKYDQHGNVKVNKKKTLLQISKFTIENIDYYFEIEKILINNTLTNDSEGKFKYSYTGKVKITKLSLINYKQKRKYLLCGSNNGIFSIFSLKTYEKIYYYEFPEKSGEITDICLLKINSDSFNIAFLINNGDLWIFNLLDDLQAKRLYDKSPISSIERLSDDYFVVGYMDMNRLEILDINGGYIQSITISNKSPKPLIYLKDGSSILAFNGSSSVGYCFDLIEFYF